MSAQVTRRSAIGFVSLLALWMTTALVGGCGLGSGSPAQCSAGLRPYKDTCVSQVVIEYLTCTEGRGVNTSTEFDASIGGSLKAVTNASLSVARKKSQQENTPVALEIVKECSDITQHSGVAMDDPDRAALAEFQQQADNSLKDFQQHTLETTPSITLSNTSAHTGGHVTVTGSQFQAGEMVDIEVDLELVKRLTADPRGSFTAVITIPEDIVVQAPQHDVSATGRTSARSDDLPIHITS